MPNRGDIVLVPFPFSDLSGQKIRPALLLSKGSKSNDVIVIFITSKITKNKSLTSVLVTPTEQNGLKVDSEIICGKIATLDKKIILGSIGCLDKANIAKVDLVLKQVLGLS